jgi:hypothetical protein
MNDRYEHSPATAGQRIGTRHGCGELYSQLCRWPALQQLAFSHNSPRWKAARLLQRSPSTPDTWLHRRKRSAEKSI